MLVVAECWCCELLVSPISGIAQLRNRHCKYLRNLIWVGHELQLVVVAQVPDDWGDGDACDGDHIGPIQSHHTQDLHVVDATPQLLLELSQGCDADGLVLDVHLSSWEADVALEVLQVL